MSDHRAEGCKRVLGKCFHYQTPTLCTAAPIILQQSYQHTELIHHHSHLKVSLGSSELQRHIISTLLLKLRAVQSRDRTWVCKGNLWSLWISQHRPNRRHHKYCNRSQASNNYGVEDGWLLNCSPSQVPKGLREKSWIGRHCVWTD